MQGLLPANIGTKREPSACLPSALERTLHSVKPGRMQLFEILSNPRS